MAVMPEARPVLERIEPVLEATVLFGTGSGAEFTVNLTQKAGEFEDEYWEVASVSIVNAGSGYLDNGAILLSEQPIDGMDNFNAEIVPQVSYQAVDGEIVSTSVEIPGWFYGTTGGLRRLHFLNKGRFFIREFNEEGDLPEVPCIGPVSTAAGWDQNKMLFQTDLSFVPPRSIVEDRVEVGEEYYNVPPELNPDFRSGQTLYHYARRCPLPEIDVELE
jgi:hypothetical protein